MFNRFTFVIALAVLSLAFVAIVEVDAGNADCSAKCRAHAVAKAKRHNRYLRHKEIAAMPTAVASWYEDGGATACGVHAWYGVAHKTLPCGQPVRMCKAKCVTAIVQDRGPFIAGREFDLNKTLKSALGCGDICTVHYKVLKEYPKSR